MSADLFAEFGYGAPASRSSQNVNSQGSSLIPGLDAFEDATPSQSTPRHLNEPTQPLAQQNTQDISPQFDDFGDFELPQDGNNNDVLFDATLETFSDDGGDDWGEFESAQDSGRQTGQTKAQVLWGSQKTLNKPVATALGNVKTSSGPPAPVDLLDSLDSFTIQDKPTADNRSHANTLVDVIPKLHTTNVKPKPKLPVEEGSFEDWGDFTDGPIEPAQGSNTKSTHSARSVSKKDEPAKASNAPPGPPQSSKPVPQSLPAGHVRPTNIPPPSILMELFPQLFEQLRKDGAEAKKNMREEEALDRVAQSIIYTLKAVARVVAGRTLRWKRDAILSQSMRIGPARSGKAGGMKLSTVNKNEDIKEQQEAVDIITMWRDRAALFNSVIQAAGKRPVQVIVENTRVMTASASQGALKASHACALCGLKRDERIPKLDESVEDSFGEWWTDHWGHTECRQFWDDNKSLLGQR
ncbi:hypothetical protein BDV18DRAFT_133455 [Aspergillus unguis]